MLDKLNRPLEDYEHAEAIPCLENALALGDTPEDTKELLVRAETIVGNQTAEDDMSDTEHYESRWKNRRLPEKSVEPFAGFDFTDFWYDDEYALKSYVEKPPTNELITEIENELGYKLPKSYIWLMKQHNGGTPNRTDFPSECPTSWAEDHVAITGIMGIGREKIYSLCGRLGSQFMIEEWKYPEIGVAICDCPSAGHDMIFLDYTYCGREGEPAVVHVSQEYFYYHITYLADCFEDFIRGLCTMEEKDDD